MLAAMIARLRIRIADGPKGPPARADRHALAPHEQRANRIRTDALQARYAAGRWLA